MSIRYVINHFHICDTLRDDVLVHAFQHPKTFFDPRLIFDGTSWPRGDEITCDLP